MLSLYVYTRQASYTQKLDLFRISKGSRIVSNVSENLDIYIYIGSAFICIHGA